MNAPPSALCHVMRHSRGRCKGRRGLRVGARPWEWALALTISGYRRAADEIAVIGHAGKRCGDVKVVLEIPSAAAGQPAAIAGGSHLRATFRTFQTKPSCVSEPRSQAGWTLPVSRTTHELPSVGHLPHLSSAPGQPGAFRLRRSGARLEPSVNKSGPWSAIHRCPYDRTGDPVCRNTCTEEYP